MSDNFLLLQLQHCYFPEFSIHLLSECHRDCKFVCEMILPSKKELGAENSRELERVVSVPKPRFGSHARKSINDNSNNSDCDYFTITRSKRAVRRNVRQQRTYGKQPGRLITMIRWFQTRDTWVINWTSYPIAQLYNFINCTRREPRLGTFASVNVPKLIPLVTVTIQTLIYYFPR